VNHLSFAPTAEPTSDRIETIGGVKIRLRPLRSMEDCRACIDLQRHVWGWNQTDVVPATLLHIVEYVGGLAAGAFDADNTMLGFVFGVSGVRGGELAHWSHMLGVRESARNMGVGRMLKEYQSQTLAALGIMKIYWSFDPLMAKNAYFNVERLGAKVVEYVPDMYGKTDSPLHYGLPTDRLVVCLATGKSVATPPDATQREGLPILTPFPRLEDLTMSIGDRSPPRVLIEMPSNVLEVIESSVVAAQTWRLAVRDHLQWALSRGYSISGVHVHGPTGRSFYVVTRA